MTKFVHTLAKTPFPDCVVDCVSARHLGMQNCDHVCPFKFGKGEPNQELIDSITNHITKHDDDWGLGQIDLNTIQKMIEVGSRIGLTFELATKVTALAEEMEDVDSYRTVIANNGYLFAYPSGKLSDHFWLEVDAE